MQLLYVRPRAAHARTGHGRGGARCGFFECPYIDASNLDATSRARRAPSNLLKISLVSLARPRASRAQTCRCAHARLVTSRPSSRRDVHATVLLTCETGTVDFGHDSERRRDETRERPRRRDATRRPRPDTPHSAETGATAVPVAGDAATSDENSTSSAAASSGDRASSRHDDVRPVSLRPPGSLVLGGPRLHVRHAYLSSTHS